MQNVHETIAADPRFQELVTKRRRFSYLLTFIVLAVYFAFVAFAILTPSAFSQPFLGTSAWSVGLIAGFCVQIFAFLMTGIYTRRANGEFDDLINAILEGKK